MTTLASGSGSWASMAAGLIKILHFMVTWSTMVSGNGTLRAVPSGSLHQENQ